MGNEKRILGFTWFLLVAILILSVLANIFHVMAWRERVDIRRIQSNRGEIDRMILEANKTNRALTLQEIEIATELLK